MLSSRGDNPTTVFAYGASCCVRKSREMYLDYFNNFLTVASFAEHYGISEEEARRIIDTEREHPDNEGKEF